MPFAIDELLNVFEKYNLLVWPMQLILNLLAIVSFWFLVFGKRYKSILSIQYWFFFGYGWAWYII